MKRIGLISLTAAAALALAACGSSSSGTPAAATTLAPTSQSILTGVVQSTGAESSSAAPTTAESVTSSAETTEESTSGESTEESTTEGPTTTLNGTLDGATALWFKTFCGGLSPAVSGMSDQLGAAMADSDPTKGQKAIADIFNQLGDNFAKTATDLTALPPPSIDKGQEVSAKLIGALAKAAPAFKEAGAKIAAAKVTTKEELAVAVSTASQDMEKAMSGLDAGGNFDLSPELKAQLKTIPECSSMLGN